MAIDAAELRRVLGQFATGITVITTVHDGVPQGMTANSFTSVSLDPPLILFCADKRARAGMLVGDAGFFAVNVLRDDQRHLSDLFAGRGTDEERRAALEAIGTPTATGSLILPNVLGWLDCRVKQVIDAGDHVVFLGEVVAASSSTGGSPLLYYRGSYQALEEIWHWRDRSAARDKTTSFHELVDFFDRMAIEGPYAELLGELIKRAEPMPEGARCLDLGCGTGRACRDLASRCRVIVGVDASAAMLDRARERARGEELTNVTFVEAQAAALPFPEGAFDRVIIANVLFYLADPVSALREAARVLRQGGRLLILEPSTALTRAAALEHSKAQSLRGFGASALLAWADAAELGRRYDEALLARDLEDAGLSLLTQDRGLSGLALLATAERAA
jgi:flavin reductase (DIM6/NTAB) family NADH-FMN oxidoreductase RutF/ubiquinone/menaquinone biosynthesis C-methylase UbiE